MQQRLLGDTSVSAIGIGDIDLAIAGARGLVVSDVERAVHDGLELGLTLVDATDDERAERLCADAVRALRLRDRAVVATRIRALAAAPGRPRDVLPERLPARYVQERVEAALRATKLDALPLVQLAIRTDWCASNAWPELAGTCVRLVREGKVMQWAAWLDLEAASRDDRVDEELAGAAALRDPFVALSVVYSACDRRAEPLVRAFADALAAETLTAAALPVEAAAPGSANRGEHERAPGSTARPDERAPSSLLIAPPPQLLAAALSGGPSNPVAGVIADDILAGAPAQPREPAPSKPLPILAREPLAGGTLAGAIGPGVKLPPRDDRNALDDATLARIAVAIAKLSSLVRRQPPAATSCDPARAIVERSRTSKVEREAHTVAELALRYVTDRAIALPRLHRRDHLAEALAALVAPPLSDETRERIDHALSSIH